jgi:hypothetical protein
MVSRVWILRFCNNFDLDWMEVLCSSFIIIKKYFISCYALQVDDVAVGQIMLDIAYQL